MIEEHVRIHDKFSIELKVGFTAQSNLRINDFSVNLWTFVPNSLDINRYSYSKEDFYRDVKSNVRLITPIYLLEDIANENKLPLRLLTLSFQNLANDPTESHISDYETHIKMFQSILKSSIRDEIDRILECRSENEQTFLITSYIRNISAIASIYRNLSEIIQTPSVEKNIFNYYLFGDEFMSNLIELHTFKLLRGLKESRVSFYQNEKIKLTELIDNEIRYKKQKGFSVIEEDSKNNNRDTVNRLNALKKYMESQLFLNIKKREDGAFIRQIYYSLAAGISMIFATIIAFSFQLKYGNFTLPLFIALVVSYMLKDRIKELSRHYFSHKLGSKYFDNKTDISFNNVPIGWYKESQSFVKEAQVPAEVIQLRNRSAILEAENRINDEKIILYRLQVELDRKDIEKSNLYPVDGVNNIIRINLSEFIRKMDNPHVPLYIKDNEMDYKIIEGEKIYYLNFILRYQYLKQIELKRYRIIFNRDGIKELERF